MAVMTVTRTTIGQKVLMAVTGFIWIGFLLLHMYGNLHAFAGAQAFNAYAEFLRTFGEPILGPRYFLTLLRVITVAALLTHIFLATKLTLRNYVSRGNNRYAAKKSVQADAAALTMKWGGLAIAIFVLFHLMQFTWGAKVVLPTFVRGNAYENMVAGFSNPVTTILYLIALVALGLHLYHGSWSMFQTLGWNNRHTTRPLSWLALAIALVIALGFAMVPLAVTFGYLS